MTYVLTTMAALVARNMEMLYIALNLRLMHYFHFREKLFLDHFPILAKIG